MGCGAFVRRASTVLAGLVTACLLIVTVAAPFSSGPYPAPLSLGAQVGYFTWAWQTIVGIVSFLVIGRLLLPGLLLAMGRRIVPQDWRELLSLAGRVLDDRAATGPRERPTAIR